MGVLVCNFLSKSSKSMENIRKWDSGDSLGENKPVRGIKRLKIDIKANVRYKYQVECLARFINLTSVKHNVVLLGPLKRLSNHPAPTLQSSVVISVRVKLHILGRVPNRAFSGAIRIE